MVGRNIFQKSNGYPNNYFGWGGEDDELRRRFQTVLGNNLKPYVKLLGTDGGLKDLENIETAREKLKIICEGEKNMVRWEGKAAHKNTWTQNGLNQDNFYVVENEEENIINNITFKTLTIKLDYEQIKPFDRENQGGPPPTPSANQG